MKIVKLKKVKIGDEYPIIRVTFKTIFGREIERDVVRYVFGWKFADTDEVCRHTVITTFDESSEFQYVLNGKK